MLIANPVNRRALWWGALLALILGTVFVVSPARPASAAGPSDLSAGREHTCAVTATGGLKCWGSNLLGQLRDGTTTDRETPADVTGLTSGVAAVSAGKGNFGEGHTCAVTTAGGVKCWGLNRDGQLGDGTNADSNTPLDVFGLTSGVTGVSVGARHTCALTTAGGVKCWGYNELGQLGDGTLAYWNTPVDVVGLTSGVSTVSGGTEHTYALTTTGSLKCWGGNQFGQLGNGTFVGSNTPVDVVGLTSGVAAVSVGDIHTCGLTTTGGVKCWGFNGHAQLGGGTFTNRNAPVDVTGVTSGG